MTRPGFAPVAPLEVLRTLQATRSLGDYHLLIAPTVLDRAFAYEQFFRTRESMTVIIDNGVVELGYPLPIRQLDQAASLIGSDRHEVVVVMPDVINNGQATARLTAGAVAEWRRLKSNVKTLGVAQGTTLKECIECAKALVEEGVDWLAISKYAAPLLGSRIELAQALYAEFPRTPVHLLGFSENLWDDIKSVAASPMVQGIDSAMPVWANDLLPLNPPDGEPHGLVGVRRPVDYWRRPVVQPVSSTNVRIVREWIAAEVARTAEARLAHPSATPSPTLSSSEKHRDGTN